jgi:pyruvate dehydrogenase E1 component
LGTDGFGRSDTRANLRRFFEVDRYHIAVAALHAIIPTLTADAIRKYGLDTERTPPCTL